MPKIEVKPTKTIASKTKTKQSIKPALQKWFKINFPLSKQYNNNHLIKHKIFKYKV